MKSQDLLLLVGTAKGLVVYRKRVRWVLDTILFKGLPVSMIHVEKQSGRWWVSLNHKHWGQKLHYSDDKGLNWEDASTPKYSEGEEIREGTLARLKYIWSIGGDTSKTIWVGTEPGGLFQSEDGGASFKLNRALWEHPTRADHWIGGGRDESGIHSIVIDPRNQDHLYIGVSCGGVYETGDGGKNWTERNVGLLADFIPTSGATAGHDPHMIRIFEKKPEVLWQQNHCGIYRSANGGKEWEEISGKEGFPYYGFAMVISQEDENTAWVIPAVSDEVRVAVNESLVVCRTTDGGKSWEEQRKGLPQVGCFDIVLRHSFDIHDQMLAFGTNNGNLFVSGDAGSSWENLNHFLATVYVVSFVNT